MVIAIIGVLFSLLAPSLSRGRHEAQKVLCLANVRSMAQGNQSFINDYGYYFPDSPQPWPVQVLPYCGNNPQVFWCPEAPASVRWNGKPFTTGYSGTPFGYSMDCWGACDGSYLGWWVNGSTSRPGRMPREIVQPSDFYWVMDSNFGLPEDRFGIWDFIFEIHAFDWCAPAEWPGARHLDGTSVVYADGHAEWLLRSDIFKAELLPRGDPERIAWRRKNNFDHQPHEEYGN